MYEAAACEALQRELVTDSDDVHVELVSRIDYDAAQSQLAALREELANHDSASLLMNAWVAEHKSQMPWDKAIELIAVVTKMPDAEKQRLLCLDDQYELLSQRLADAERRNGDYLSLLRAARNCHNSPGIGNKDAWSYHRLDGRINEALSAANGAGYQSREIGESDWTNCDTAEYDRCTKDPHMDTRINPNPEAASHDE
ncbi:hypothetical protein D3C86_1628360 [compost metagenome]